MDEHQLLSVFLIVGRGVFLVDDSVSDLGLDFDFMSFLVGIAGADGNDVGNSRFVFMAGRNDDSADFLFFGNLFQNDLVS